MEKLKIIILQFIDFYPIISIIFVFEKERRAVQATSTPVGGSRRSRVVTAETGLEACRWVWIEAKYSVSIKIGNETSREGEGLRVDRE